LAPKNVGPRGSCHQPPLPLHKCGPGKENQISRCKGIGNELYEKYTLATLDLVG